MVTSEQLDALDGGQLDIGLMRPHGPHGGVEDVLLGRESLMLAVQESESARWPTNPTLECLEGKRFLTYSPYEAQYFYHLVQTALAEARVRPDIVEYVPQIHTMLALVDCGVGVALIPETASRLHFEGVHLRRIKTTPAKPVEMVSYRKDNDNPILEIFREKILGGLGTSTSSRKRPAQRSRTSLAAAS